MFDLTPDKLVMGFLWFITFLFSTTCHEASHALAAKIGGDDTAWLGGQVTLNPWPHMRRAPFGMVVIPLITWLGSGGQYMMGWASAPYNPQWERRYPRRAAWMAAAGPAANFALMLLAAIGLRVGSAMHWLHASPTGGAGLPLTLLWIFFSLNLLLGTFNLLPVPPLDGSTVIMLFMSEERAHAYLDWLRGNNFVVAGLLVGLVVFQRIFPAIEAFATSLLLRGGI
jgi:Zn-dependent protease